MPHIYIQKVQGIVFIPSCKTNLLLASATRLTIYNCAPTYTGGLYKVQPCGANYMAVFTWPEGQAKPLPKEESTTCSSQRRCCTHRANLELAYDVGELLKNSINGGHLRMPQHINKPTCLWQQCSQGVL